MSERSNGTTPPRGDVPAGVPSITPTALHEQLWEQIDLAIEEKLKDSQPVMATVRGRQGGNIRVLRDDEDEDRDVGYTRGLGTRKKNGDRVLLIPTGAKHPVVFGPVSGGGEGAGERVVGQQDIEDGAIEGSVIKDKGVSKGKLDQDLQNKIEGAATKEQVDKKADANHSHNYAANNHNHNNDYAGKSHNHGEYATSSKLTQEINAVKDWVSRNFEKKGKSGGS